MRRVNLYPRDISSLLPPSRRGWSRSDWYTLDLRGTRIKDAEYAEYAVGRGYPVMLLRGARNRWCFGNGKFILLSFDVYEDDWHRDLLREAPVLISDKKLLSNGWVPQPIPLKLNEILTLAGNCGPGDLIWP